MMPKEKRGLSLAALFILGCFVVWLGFRGWSINHAPAQYIGYALIAVAIAGVLGANIWYGGPLDPRRERPGGVRDQLQATALNVDALKGYIAKRLRGGEKREVIRADLVSRTVRADVVDALLGGFRGEWRIGPLGRALQVLGVALLAAGVALLMAFLLGYPPGFLSRYAFLSFFRAHPLAGYGVMMIGVALCFTGTIKRFRIHRDDLSGNRFPLCANCGATTMFGRKENGKCFCNRICLENFRHPGFCSACIAGSTGEDPGVISRVNGTGGWLYGGADRCPTCYSAIMRKWLCLFWLPLIPLEQRFRAKRRTASEYFGLRGLPAKGSFEELSRSPRSRGAGSSSPERKEPIFGDKAPGSRDE